MIIDGAFEFTDADYRVVLYYFILRSAARPTRTGDLSASGTSGLAIWVAIFCAVPFVQYNVDRFGRIGSRTSAA